MLALKKFKRVPLGCLKSQNLAAHKHQPVQAKMSPSKEADGIQSQSKDKEPPKEPSTNSSLSNSEGHDGFITVSGKKECSWTK